MEPIDYFCGGELMEEVIDEGHEGDAEDGEVTVVFLFEVS